jgi:glycosyltransferase involved in cell wall biosynthesis
MALVEWVQGTFTAETAPKIVASLAWFPGAKPAGFAGGAQQWAIQDINSLLYRYAGTSIRSGFEGRLNFVCLHKEARDAYAFLCGRPVPVLPHPCRAESVARERRRGSSITVAFLGEQRPNKGLHMLPGIVERLLASRGVRVLVQNAFTGPVSEMQQLQQMAQREAGLEVIVQALSAPQWSKLLDRCDLIVLPYDQTDYSNVISGIALEALANAIPLAVPQNTGMARTLEEFDMPGIAFERSDPDMIVAALLAAVEQFDDLAERAHRASLQWNAANGPDRLVEKILAL